MLVGGGRAGVMLLSGRGVFFTLRRSAFLQHLFFRTYQQFVVDSTKIQFCIDFCGCLDVQVSRAFLPGLFSVGIIYVMPLVKRMVERNGL